MTKTYGRVLTSLFCGFLGGVLLLSLLLPDRARSETENRTLQQLPAFSWKALVSGKFTGQVETYVADQFPGRDGWTGLRSRLERAVGKTEFNGVYLCGDTLIARVDAPEGGLAEQNLSYVRKLAEKTDIPVYLGLIPSAAELWSGRLPAGAESWDQAAFLQTAAEETGLPMIDFRGVLEARADEPIFYRTDHHWTTLGAYCGYTAVLDALGRGDEAPAADAFDHRVLPGSDRFDGTLYSKSGIHWLKPDTIEFWVPEEGISVTSWRSGSPEAAALYETSFLGGKDKYSVFLGGNQPLCVLKNENVPAGGKLLVVRDSYSDALAPFLAQNFSEVHLLDLRYYRASVAQYAADNGIDTIAVVYSVPNFITDQNLVFLGQ